ncbi:MFS transporter [Nocardiopsis chromatogenes]|uniref:MFS transporter n=1 Tax=Nocardiopsis chromatogenes TaxID=280239 RepID=UPI000347D05E|nr:MFS transporter [Nocardiopsis chromatogenes]
MTGTVFPPPGGGRGDRTATDAGSGDSVLAPLRSGAFRALGAGRTLMYFGNGLAQVALAFAVLDATGSVVHLGLVIGTRTLANVVLLLAGGVLADRLPRAAVLRGACAIAALSQGLLALALAAGVASMPLMLVLAAVNGAAAAANLPAAASLVPQTVPASLLRQANGLMRIGVETGRLIGMSAGTMLVALLGSAAAIAADAGAFALAGVCFAFVRVPAASAANPEPAHPLRDLADGWSEFVRRSWVWVVVVQFLVVNMVHSSMVAVIGPVIADEGFGRATWGLLLTVNSIGLLAGGVLAARWQPRRALLFGVGLTAIEAAPILALGLAPAPVLLFPLFFLAGMAMEQFSVAWEVSLQENIPQERLARVYSYDALGSLLAVPLGQAVAGPVAEAAGPGPALTGAAALSLGATALALCAPAVRTLRRDPVPPP